MTLNYLEQDPNKLMQKHGKSFHFASQVFTKAQMEKVALLYSLCRYIDDCADELNSSHANKALTQLYFDLEDQQEQTHIQQAIQKLRSFGVRRSHIRHLIDGAHFDANNGRIVSENDLLTYCFKVAGVVGLMMNPILGVSDKDANDFAIDLGIAMQLTNICRDVLEDAQNERYYLPLYHLNKLKISTNELKKQGETSTQVRLIISHYLQLANQYYASALKGLGYIPFRARLAVLIAAYVYRAIGYKIAQNNYDVLRGRFYLSKTEKIVVTIKALTRVFYPSFWKPSLHENPGRSFA